MPDPTVNIPALLETTLRRVRAIDADFSDLSDTLRAQYRIEEIARTLHRIPTPQQAAFLTDLRKQLSEPEIDAAGRSLDALAVLRTKLALTDEDPPLDAPRALEILSDLTAFSHALDQLVWSTWRQIGSKTSLRRTNPLQKTLARYLTDPPFTRPQATQELERLRQLAAALIAAMGQIGQQFFQKHLHKFQPDEVQALVKSERAAGVFVAEEVKYWRKYKDLSRGLDEATVEAAIQLVIAEYAEKLIKGLER